MCVDLMYASNGILDINKKKNILMLTAGPQCEARGPYSNQTNISQTRSKQGLLLRAG